MPAKNRIVIGFVRVSKKVVPYAESAVLFVKEILSEVGFLENARIPR